jgi:hypothetical protein
MALIRNKIMKREIIDILMKKILITREEILKKGILINYKDEINDACFFLVKEIKNNKVNSMKINKLCDSEEIVDFIIKLFPSELLEIDPVNFKDKGLTIKILIEKTADSFISESLKNRIPYLEVII